MWNNFSCRNLNDATCRWEYADTTTTSWRRETGARPRLWRTTVGSTHCANLAAPDPVSSSLSCWFRSHPPYFAVSGRIRLVLLVPVASALFCCVRSHTPCLAGSGRIRLALMDPVRSVLFTGSGTWMLLVSEIHNLKLHDKKGRESESTSKLSVSASLVQARKVLAHSI